MIVNTASIAAFDAQIGQAAYAASKAGIVGLTPADCARVCVKRNQGQTVARYSIRRCSRPCPKPRARPSVSRFLPSRLGRPDEYASLVRHIIENEMLNGEVIRLDGALRMAPK